MVKPPAISNVLFQAGTLPKTGVNLASRYMPALTMVAECRYVETGVGAFMAPGNQKCSGYWADLENAAINRQTMINRYEGCSFSSPVKPVISRMEYVPVTLPKTAKAASKKNPPKPVTASATRADLRDSVFSLL